MNYAFPTVASKPVSLSFLERDADTAPYLTKEQEVSAALAWHEYQDQAAMQTLVLSHFRLVRHAAFKLRNYGLPHDDLCQEGCIGLIDAVHRFNPDLGHRFSTYAMWWIRARMHTYILNNWSMVKFSTDKKKKTIFFKLRSEYLRITGTSPGLDQADVIEELAKRFEVSTDVIREMSVRLITGDKSLNEPVIHGEYDHEAQDLMPSTDADPEEVAIHAIDGDHRADWLRRSLATLTPREQLIVRRRRLCEPAETLEAIGVDLGVSRERVRQIEARGMAKLTQALRREDPELASELEAESG